MNMERKKREDITAGLERDGERGREGERQERKKRRQREKKIEGE